MRATRSRRGDQVFAHIWIGNGATQEMAYSTYDGQEPQLLTVDEQSLSPLFLAGRRGPDDRLAGRDRGVRGDRVRAEGNAALNIGNKDTVLTIIDIISGIEDGADGKEQRGPGVGPGPPGRRGRTRPASTSPARRSRPTSSSRRSWCRATARSSSRARPSPSTTSARSTRARSPSTRATPAARRRSRSASAPSSRAGTRRWSARPSAAGSSRDPAEARLRRAGQPAGRHQGHRHALLRGRHPRRSLRPGTATWRREE